MTIDISALDEATRLLLEADLKPAQGTRFQPTGFPDLGAAVYDVPGAEQSTRMLLLESAQSIANRLESTCWDDAADTTVEPLAGMPYVAVQLWNGQRTSSILEAHRLNSPYIMKDTQFAASLRDRANLPTRGKSGTQGDVEQDAAGPGLVDRRALARAVFYYDPCSVLHGVFLEKLDGRARLQRCISGFIEAENVEIASSGGVKNDRVAASPQALKQVGLSVGAAQGYGNVPFHRDEFTAERIRLYVSLDLAQIHAYGLPSIAEQFLVTLGLWKVRRFLDAGLRLRTACDLELMGDLVVQRPSNVTIPEAGELEQELRSLIKRCATEGLFADPPVTVIQFPGKP
jgi:CRISPR-associated protein Csb1